MVLKPDVLVIGAGPGGYPAAIRAAQLGLDVIVVDKGHIGGECLNWGCIPSKALITAVNFYHKLKTEVNEWGITVKEATVDFQKLQQWKTDVQTRLINGIRQLFKANGVKLLIGTASFLSREQVEVKLEDGSTEIIEPRNVIIATGAGFISIPGFEIDEEHVLSAKGVINLDHIPTRLLCIGGGVIGLELGTVFAKLGSEVTIVELLPEILPSVDPTLVRVLKTKLRKLGVTIYTESKATKWEKNADGTLKVTVETKKKGTIVVEADKILLSVGKLAVTKDLNLDRAGIETDRRGFIKVNERQQTNVPHIYAIGDCTGEPFLAHRATKQGLIAAEVIAGHQAAYDFKAMPGAIFTDPEIAFAGMNENEAKEAGHEVMTGRFPFAASGRAQTQGDDLGFVKVIAEKDSGVLLGIQIVGPHASELISEAALALEMGATLEDLAWTVHPHPTLPETLMEAAEAAYGKAIHIANPLARKK